MAITHHKILPRTPQWLAFRSNGIGCSEIKKLLYPDDYGDALTLYYEKLGIKKDVLDNEAMFHGRNLEDYVARCWEHWDGVTDTYGTPNYIHNMEAKNNIRRCRNINSIVVNSKYPWLFANPDRLINIKGGFNMLTGEKLTEEGVLEIKTTEGFAAEKWKYGIDPSFLIQLNGYLLILERVYGEVAVLKNGRYLDVFPFDKSNQVCELILENTHEFWYKHVVPGRKWMEKKALAELTENKSLADECNHEVHMLEPVISHSSAANDFIKENYRKDKEEMFGSEELYEKGVYDKYLTEVANQIDQIKEKNKNEIKLEFYHTGTEFFSFGDRGRMRYFTKAGGKAPQLGNNLKVKIDKGEVETKISKIL
jgi:predicted phage-related endonuclease